MDNLTVPLSQSLSVGQRDTLKESGTTLGQEAGQ